MIVTMGTPVGGMVRLNILSLRDEIGAVVDLGWNVNVHVNPKSSRCWYNGGLDCR